MKYFYLTLLIIICNLDVFSQDLIVTDKNDSLNCRITKIKEDFIYFTFKHENEIRNTLLPVSQVKYHQKDFFQNPEVPFEKAIEIKNYPKWKISGIGGFSYLTGKISSNIPAQLQSYYKDLKSGMHLGTDVNYFFSESIGAGIKYTYFYTQNSIDGISIINNTTGEIKSGTLSDKISIHYMGPAVCTRIISGNKKTHFISNLSFGYAAYKNDATIVDSFILTSNTIAMIWDVGVDFMVGKNLALGVIAGLTSGTLTKYEMDNGITTQTIKLDKNNYESISRFDISAGLKWIR